MVFAKKPYTERELLTCIAEYYRIAKCGTTKESAKAGFFVSPKTKRPFRIHPNGQKILKYAFLLLTFTLFLIQ
jgi:hypothetical protein